MISIGVKHPRTISLFIGENYDQLGKLSTQI